MKYFYIWWYFKRNRLIDSEYLTMTFTPNVIMMCFELMKIKVLKFVWNMKHEILSFLIVHKHLPTLGRLSGVTFWYLKI